MSETTIITQRRQFQGYDLLLNEAYSSEEFLAELADLAALLARGEQISHGKDYVVKSVVKVDDKERVVAIKVFKPQSWIKDAYDRKHHSKAVRSYLAAEALINRGLRTPTPIAMLERWNNDRLEESYYICEFEAATCLRDELWEIYRTHKDSAPLMALLELVAPAIRKMHDAGFMHGDLGNQNILLPKNADGSWAEPCFIDLNRYRLYDGGVPAKGRATDLARPILPGNYLHFFLQIYSGHQEVSQELGKLHSRERAKFTRHRNSWKIRHPIRYLKSRNKPSKSGYPLNKDYWLWDEKTAQPMIALSKQEKNQERNPGDFLKSAGRALIKLPRIMREYKALSPQAFANPVELKGRIGVALNPKPYMHEAEDRLLTELGNPPVLVRFYRHETPEQWSTTIALIESLHARKIPVMAALLQDRDCVNDPALWDSFLEYIIPAIVDKTTQVEITHAYNRAKWGVWNLAELRQLFASAFRYKAKYPELKITGPACIDFEYAPVVSALAELKSINSDYRFDALSHLLYVDRRGAPESFQGKFSTLEKAQLLKAIARSCGASSDKTVVSEVNWPIENTDVWSPIVCPYVTARWQKRPSGEPEDVYAFYMLRYLAITLCSGFVDEVYWWQLSSKGYGLVDDQDGYRIRPAFTALQFFLALLGESRFERRHNTESEDYIFEFSRGQQAYLMAWTTHDDARPLTVDFDQAWNYLGEPVANATLSGAPIYLSLKR